MCHNPRPLLLRPREQCECLLQGATAVGTSSKERELVANLVCFWASVTAATPGRYPGTAAGTTTGIAAAGATGAGAAG
eukprot:CAMPEP_0182912122 /NCGR_PEP_ID=MMETSP0034_2-20130328/37348_1 /TAXON_ID=156128 /ORGANISM="Nephroselmis pyriformis, Strain CCMP717" /LENGTH=77 /DNA_ID=CAMNT_0025048775 /DNA_START=48 /DNA_END=278 /DNA_ORIENTATION=-